MWQNPFAKSVALVEGLACNQQHLPCHIRSHVLQTGVSFAKRPHEAAASSLACLLLPGYVTDVRYLRGISRDSWQLQVLQITLTCIANASFQQGMAMSISSANEISISQLQAISAFGQQPSELLKTGSREGLSAVSVIELRRHADYGSGSFDSK